MLHENHSLIEGFKTALENAPPEHQYEVVIRADKRPTGTHERVYNAPEVDEVAILIAGDARDPRDIIIRPEETIFVK